MGRLVIVRDGRDAGRVASSFENPIRNLFPRVLMTCDSSLDVRGGIRAFVAGGARCFRSIRRHMPRSVVVVYGGGTGKRRALTGSLGRFSKNISAAEATIFEF